MSAPTALKCQVTATTSLSSAPAVGASGTVTIDTTRDCTWTASAGASWITITSANSGQGSGTIDFRVGANPEHAARRGAIAVNDTQLSIDQQAAPCTFTVTPANAAVSAGGGRITVEVSAGTGCTWTAASGAGWLSVTGGANGPGTATINVAANTGPARTATVTIADQAVTIAQADGTVDCPISLTKASDTFTSAGGTGSVGITPSGPSCKWSAASGADWVTIVGPASGTGPGQLQYAVAANSSTSERRTTLTIGGSVLTIVQSADATPPPPPPACSFTIGSSTYSAPASGATTTVAVTAGASCGWSAVSSAGWITITSGASGSGSGSVALQIAANTGAARTGTVNIAGQTFTVTQAAASCAFQISPTSSTAPAAGAPGSVSVTVTSGTNCPWTAASNANWITITSGTSGTGNGTVAFSVAANTGASRTGTLTIAGQTYTVTQDPAPTPTCALTVTPTGSSVPANGGAFSASVAVTSGSNCGWTAVSNAAWITVTGGATGTDNGTVAFSVAANTGPSRIGTLTIAGQTYTVSQDGVAPCAFSIAPTSATVPASGGAASATVTMTSGTNCPWTAVSNNPDWISVTGGASGTGNGTVAFTVAANSGLSRTGTLTIAGQTLTVSQGPAAAACTYTITPTSGTYPARGGDGSIAVTANDAGCPWTAVSTVDWITITGGASGAGNGTVTFTVDRNKNGAPARTGTITVAGQTFTVTQDAG